MNILPTDFTFIFIKGEESDIFLFIQASSHDLEPKFINMTKNGLAPEAAASDIHISKRQKLAPTSENDSSSTALFQIPINQSAPENPSKMTTETEISKVQPPAGDEQARELKAGIEQYVNTKVNGFRGILKQR
jgi:hypothetical protein